MSKSSNPDPPPRRKSRLTVQEDQHGLSRRNVVIDKGAFTHISDTHYRKPLSWYQRLLARLFFTGMGGQVIGDKKKPELVYLWEMTYALRIRAGITSIFERLRLPRSTTFTGWVANSALKRRIALLPVLAILIILPSFGFGARGFPWGIVIVLVLIVTDLCLILYRKKAGRYGDNDLEFSEAVRSVIKANESGNGPGGFDRVFEQQPLQQDIYEWVPQGAGVPS